MDRELYEQSLRKILDSQSHWGSYIASPAFPTYQYCWLRDGSFIAHAMDMAGEFDSAKAFFRWVGRTILKYAAKVEKVQQYMEASLPINKDDMLHTRYTLDGNEVNVDSSWGNAQIDGYGTWLWALAEHLRLSKDTGLVKELSEAIHITLRYLALVWKLPGYDCWEEHPDFLHPYSLATVFSGFKASRFLSQQGQINIASIPLEDLVSEVKEFILHFGVHQGRLTKHIKPGKISESTSSALTVGVDSSLIGVSVPYGVLVPNDPIMWATIQTIESELHRPKGGVYRYKADVYYGGGEWLLLTAWLGWFYATLGKFDLAEALCRWVEGQADEHGDFPEQVSDHLLAPQHYSPWLQKWGPVAKPLTWSHAMYVILVNVIKDSQHQ